MGWGLYCLLITLLCTWNIESFEVKVLLQKLRLSELADSSIELFSEHGFFISNHATKLVGKKHSQNQLVITSKENQFFIGNIPLRDTCYIMPLLSEKQQNRACQLVQNYFIDQKKNIKYSGEELVSFFNCLVSPKNDKSLVSYDVLQKYAQQIIESFFKHIVQDVQGLEAVVTLDTLVEQASLFIKNRIKYDFLQRLALKKLAKKDLHLLQQNAEYRYVFFIHHVSIVIQKLLQQFLETLPQNIFSLLIDQDVAYLSYNGNQYRGTFVLLLEGDVLYLINYLDIDDYLMSVVRNEGWPGWPLEVNKVLAVACRTYLVWQILQSQKIKRPYHIENGIRHQTYKGHHKYARLKKAVDETKDICIALDGKPILAMFDSCCGGIVSADIDISLDFKKHTYLLRKIPCVYCRSCKVASWKAEVPYDEMLAALQQEIPSLVAIDTLSVTKRDNAGLVKEVTAEANGAKVMLTGKKMYSLFSAIKSFCFDIETLPRVIPEKKTIKKLVKKKKAIQDQHSHLYTGEKRFLITGKGYGHHLGLCQWGAMKLVKDHHWNYKNILQFYYPGTTLIKLQYKR